MDASGNCINCPNKCHWTSHRNLPYLVELYTVKETRTIEELRRQFVDANSGLSAADQIIGGLTNQFVDQEDELSDLIMDKDEHSEQLVESEESKRARGWQGRVQALCDILKRDHQVKQIGQGKFRGTWIGQYEDVLVRVNARKEETKVGIANIRVICSTPHTASTQSASSTYFEVDTQRSMFASQHRFR